MSEVACSRCGALDDRRRDPGICPSCGELLVDAPPPTPACAQELDVCALVREALAEHQPGEEIESALRRVTNDPRGEGMICQVVCKFLAMHASQQGISREEVARQMAEGNNTHMKILPDGTPFLESLAINVKGLESLPQAMREQVLWQIQQAVSHGNVPQPVVLTPRRSSSDWIVGLAVLAGLTVVVVVYLLSR